MYIPIQNLQGTWSAIKTEVLKLGPAVGSGLASVQKFIGVGVSGKGTDLGLWAEVTVKTPQVQSDISGVWQLKPIAPGCCCTRATFGRQQHAR